LAGFLIRFFIRLREVPAVGEKPSVRVGEILPRVFEIMGLASKLEEAKLLAGWADVVGTVIAGKSRPREFRDGILYIEVENSVWMQELWFRQKQIIERIKKEHPNIEVKGIRLGIERESK